MVGNEFILKKGGNRYKEHLYREVAHFQNYIQWRCGA